MKFFSLNIIISILLAFPVSVPANGSPYYFDNVLGKALGSWMGYRVLALDVTSFSLDVLEVGRKNVYQLTYEWNEAIEKNLKAATFVSVQPPGLYGFRDLGFLQRVKPDEVGLPDATIERYLWFRKDELNGGMLLAFIPLGEATVPLGSPLVMDFEKSRASFGFLKGSRPDQNGYFLLDGTTIQFRFSIDMEPDGVPDLAVFVASMDYTRTYLLGRVDEKWIVIQVGYPQ